MPVGLRMFYMPGEACPRLRRGNAVLCGTAAASTEVVGQQSASRVREGVVVLRAHAGARDLHVDDLPTDSQRHVARSSHGDCLGSSTIERDDTEFRTSSALNTENECIHPRSTDHLNTKLIGAKRHTPKEVVAVCGVMEGIGALSLTDHHNAQVVVLVAVSLNTENLVGTSTSSLSGSDLRRHSRADDVDPVISARTNHTLTSHLDPVHAVLEVEVHARSLRGELTEVGHAVHAVVQANLEQFAHRATSNDEGVLDAIGDDRVETTDVRTASRKLLSSDVEVDLSLDLSHVVVEHPQTVEARGLLRQEYRPTVLGRRHERRRLVRSRRRVDVGANRSHTSSRIDLEQVNLEPGETETPDRLAVVHGSERACGSPLVADPGVDLAKVVRLTDSVEIVTLHSAVEVGRRVVTTVHHRATGSVRILERRTDSCDLSLLEHDRRVVLVVRSQRDRERPGGAHLRGVEQQVSVVVDHDGVLDPVDPRLQNPVDHVLLEVEPTELDQLVAHYREHVCLSLVPDERDTEIGRTDDGERIAHRRVGAVHRHRRSRGSDVAVGVRERQLDVERANRGVAVGRRTAGSALVGAVAPVNETGNVGAVRVVDRPRSRGGQRSSTAGHAQTEVLGLRVVLHRDGVLRKLCGPSLSGDSEDVLVRPPFVRLVPRDLHVEQARRGRSRRTGNRDARSGRLRDSDLEVTGVELGGVVAVLDDRDHPSVERFGRVHLDLERDLDPLGGTRGHNRVLDRAYRLGLGGVAGRSAPSTTTSATAATCGETGETHHYRDGSDGPKGPTLLTLHFNLL